MGGVRDRQVHPPVAEVDAHELPGGGVQGEPLGRRPLPSRLAASVSTTTMAPRCSRLPVISERVVRDSPTARAICPRLIAPCSRRTRRTRSS
ncbi:hypothetical protein LUX33_16100 [Actinomadura madurae]|uniref:hypothetical protein n=1 Tax=Actinomadura madurae TaxID=1993 RepID=UPI0020D22DDE|nr:hypothetical protein [Actinomadura madurae]MCP9949769.1 hypothetical protein [Actinomadura madurae]MCP9966517.1 hypothetical protein [Actinomadura madurae]